MKLMPLYYWTHICSYKARLVYKAFVELRNDKNNSKWIYTWTKGEFFEPLSINTDIRFSL